MSVRRLIVGVAIAVAGGALLIGGTVFGIEVWKWELAVIGFLLFALKSGTGGR